MKIALFSQDINQDVETVFKSILSHKEALKNKFFINENLRNFIDKEDLNSYPFFHNHEDLNENLDLFISIGGDGTFLRSIELVRNLNLLCDAFLNKSPPLCFINPECLLICLNPFCIKVFIKL